MSTKINVLEVLRYAMKIHANQEYSPGIPYWQHCLDVAMHLDDPLDQGIALLHDALEDTDADEATIRALIGDEGLEIVKVLTRDKDNETYFEYIKRVADYPNRRAARIKNQDLWSNWIALRSATYFEGERGTSLNERYEKALDMLFAIQVEQMEQDLTKRGLL